MAKVLKLKSESQALLINGVNPGSIVEVKFADETPNEVVALEINANTSERAIVPNDNLLTINGHAIFCKDHSVVEM